MVCDQCADGFQKRDSSNRNVGRFAGRTKCIKPRSGGDKVSKQRHGKRNAGLQDNRRKCFTCRRDHTIYLSTRRTP